MEIAQSEMGYSQSKFTCANIATANTALRVSVLYCYHRRGFLQVATARCSTTRFRHILVRSYCAKANQKRRLAATASAWKDPTLSWRISHISGLETIVRTNGCHRRSPVEPCPVVKDRRLADALKQTNSAVRGRGTEFRRFHANTCGCRQGQDENTPPDRHRRLSPVK